MLASARPCVSTGHTNVPHVSFCKLIRQNFDSKVLASRSRRGRRGELRHEKAQLTAQLNEVRAAFHAFRAEHEGLPAALRDAKLQLAAAQADAEALRPEAAAAAALRGECDGARGELATALAERDRYAADVSKYLETITQCTEKLAKRRADNEALAAQARFPRFAGLMLACSMRSPAGLATLAIASWLYRIFAYPS